MQAILRFPQARPRVQRRWKFGHLPARMAAMLTEVFALACLLASLGGGLVILSYLVARIPG